MKGGYLREYRSMGAEILHMWAQQAKLSNAGCNGKTGEGREWSQTHEGRGERVGNEIIGSSAYSQGGKRSTVQCQAGLAVKRVREEKRRAGKTGGKLREEGKGCGPRYASPHIQTYTHTHTYNYNIRYIHKCTY